MALIVKDRVKETASTPGVGAITLLGASTGYRSFADIGNGNTTYYCIADQSGSNWELGVGTWATGNILTRTTVISNSLGTTATINFSSGIQDVFCTYPSEYALLGTNQSLSSTGTGSVVLDNNPVFATDITVNSATVGLGAGSDIGTRQTNIAFGQDALLNNTNGSFNVAVGGSALRTNTLGTNNLAIGGQALFSNTIGTDNVGIGFSALATNLNGSFNTGVGSSALANSRGSNNIGIGSYANSVGTGSGTIGIGANSLIGLTTGTNHIAIGDNVLASAITGTNSIYIGANSDTDAIKTGADAPIEQIVIGSNTLGNGDYTTTIGSASTTATYLKGKTITNALTALGELNLGGSATVGQNIAAAQTTGTLTIGGTGATGAITLGQSTGTQTTNIQASATASGSTKIVNIGTGGLAGSTSNIAIGSTTGTSTTTVNGYFKPPALASAPTYVKGAVYFDTTLNKLRVGGATTWETITSI